MIQFTNSSTQFKEFSFNSLFLRGLSEMQKNSANLIFELLLIREGQLFLPQSFLSNTQLSDIIDYISTV